MRRLPRRNALLWIVVACATPGSVARAQAIGQAFELERAGRTDQAAEFYLATLRADPTNLPSLLGLERVLPRLHRIRDLVGPAQRAAALDSTNDDIAGVLLRTYVLVNEPDSARAVARRWALRSPGDEAPYREWAAALEHVAAHDAARAVLLSGRHALGPTSFGIELAQLDARAGDWVSAAREWGSAVAAEPSQQPNATAQLERAPDPQHEAIVQALSDAADPAPYRQLAAELLLAWGDAPRAWTMFAPTVPPRAPDALYALHRFADLAAGLKSPAAWRVRALALTKFADLATGPMVGHARADAARAYFEAGDSAAARTMLERVVADSAAPPEAQQMARAALIRMLVQGGKMDSAAWRLTTLGDGLTADDRTALRFALARAHIRHGDLALADSALARDSSIEAVALHGWIALYRGEMGEARRLFRAAGPYAGDRRDATERTAMLAMIERIPEDQFPALGGALATLARGDSAHALVALQTAADQLTPARGRPDVLLLAGRIAARLGVDGERTAVAIFSEIVRTGGTGAAPPAAELAWARLLVQQGNVVEAMGHLEHLILTYPESAVVPEARRELERTKGAIPQS